MAGVALDPNVMVQDSILIRSLAASLSQSPDSWKTNLVSWSLEQRSLEGRSLERRARDSELCVSAVFTVGETSEERAFGLWMPCATRTRPESALDVVIELADNSKNPSFVAGLLRELEQVYVSPYMPGRAMLHEAPLLTSFAREPTRWSALVAWHPQLAPGTSLVKFFPENSSFFLSGKYLAALCANARATQLQVFEVNPQEQSLASLEPVRVDEMALHQLVELLKREVALAEETETETETEPESETKQAEPRTQTQTQTHTPTPAAVAVAVAPREQAGAKVQAAPQTKTTIEASATTGSSAK
jgi:hypothetical protein